MDMWTNDGPNIYVTEDKSEVVYGDGDPRARWLLVAAGAQLPLAEAERYGLTADRKAAAEKAKQEQAANKLKAESPPNKSK